MNHYYLIFFIASRNTLLLPALSDNLFSSNYADDLLWDPEGLTTTQATMDDFNSGIESMDLGVSVDPISFENDDETLFTKNDSQNLCAAAEANDFTLEARDDKSSCQIEKTASSPAMSPESIQLFQDPIPVLSNPSKKKQRPNGSGEPPNLSEPPLYPGFLLNDKEAELEGDLKAMSLGQSDRSFFCLSQLRIVPVCCDGPFRSPNMLENCDEGKIS